MSDRPKSTRTGATGSAILAVVTILAAALVGLVLRVELPAGVPTWAPWVVVLVLTAIGIWSQIAKVVRDVRRDAEAANFRVQLRDALLPVTSLVADMDPGASQLVRREQVKTAATATVAGIGQLISPHSKRLRANVFWIDPDADGEVAALVWLAHAGRGERPEPFVQGTARGDAAFEYLVRVEAQYYADLRRSRPPGYQGSESGYRTFISVPVWATGRVFGMITVDSPQQRSLTLEDLYVVEMFADVMSIAFDRGARSPWDSDADVEGGA
jgi:GAF domain-containing protein